MLDKLREKCASLYPMDPVKYKLIQSVLKEKDAFLNMDIEVAYAIFKDLKIPHEEFAKVYYELTKKEENANGLS